jgi:pimeloyl-ACP methyl ester carboxylesterase
MLYLFIILLILVAGLIVGVLYYSQKIIFPKVYSHEYVRNYALEGKHYDPSYLEEFRKERINLTNPKGYTLKAIVYHNNPDKFVILCHGITSNYDGMKKYASIYLKKGYSVLLYDHRNHGYNMSCYTSLGYLEKQDTKVAFDYIKKHYNNSVIGVHGESMGASTAMQFASIEPNLSFCVEDCGYDNAYDLMSIRASKDHHPILKLLTKPTDIYLGLFYKFKLSDIDYKKYLKHITCPVLFIHGEADDYVPYFMVHNLYDSFNGEKALLTIPNARHAESILVDPKAYESGIHNFLKEFVE